MMESYYIGVDVGTASVRAALITHDGRIVSSATKPLQIWQPLTDYYEQSSEDVWRNVCLVVKVLSKFLFCVCDPLEVCSQTRRDNPCWRGEVSFYHRRIRLVEDSGG